MAAHPERGSRRLVTVVHFPKAGKAVAAPRRTMTLPEISAYVPDDPVTEPEGRHLLDDASQPRPTPLSARSLKKAKGRRKTAELPVPEALVNVVADPALSADERSDLAAMGHQLFELGRVQEARAIFERLISGASNDAYAHTMLGTIFLALADQDRALALFQAALDIDPNDIAARVYRGEVRLGKGKVRPALEDFERAMELGPADDPFVDRASRLLKMARTAFRRIKR